jgi:hypothetical protein
MLHAKIVAATRECVVALASKKSTADIVCHTGNLRKYAAAKQQQAAVAKAAIYVVGKPAAVAKLATAKPHPAAEPPALAQPAAVATTTNDVGTIEISTVNLVATFDDYTVELDDG